MKKRIFCLLLAVCMAVSMLPSAMADNVCGAVSQTYIPDVELPSNDELFAGYVEAQLYGGSDISVFAVNRTAGSRLNGDNEIIYDKLSSVIKNIAAGGRESTVVKIGQTIGDVGNVIVPDTECRVLFSEISDNFNLKLVIDALLSDLPYEMYWFDKTTAVNAQIYANAETNVMELVILTFQVSSNYRSENYSAESPRVDTSKIPDSEMIAANAAKVVKNNVGLSDEEKLTAYKDWICGEVSYNVAALSGSYSVDNDPWQLIYVFDGDQTTNVVCEGYAKAFQYLCDLTTWGGAVECYTVTGDMYGGTGAGAHMWNIVRIDGKSYLVDITNVDGNAIGSGGELFLAGAEPVEELINSQNQYCYSIPCGNNKRKVKFVYDTDTTSLWGADWVTNEENILHLSSVNYGESEAGTDKVEITPDMVTLDSMEFMYTGNEIKPSIVVMHNANILTEDTDYTVEYANTTDVGMGKVTITGKGSYSGTIEKTFTIIPRTLKILYAVPENNKVYDGNNVISIKNVAFFDADNKPVMLEKDNDYIAAGSVSSEKAGKYSRYTAEVEIINTNYILTENTISSDGEFTISKRPITITAGEQSTENNSSIDQSVWEISGTMADGEEIFVMLSVEGSNIIPSAVVKKGDNNVTDNYAITYVNGKLITKEHEHKWIYSGNGNIITATCDCIDSPIKITLNAPLNLSYDASAKSASISVSDEGINISDVEIAYTGSLTDSKPINAGDYTASITIGETTVSVEFTIEKAVPEITGTGTAAGAYGAMLKNIMVNGLTAKSGDRTVEGTWKIISDEIPNAGIYTKTAVFTPNDTDNYCSAETEVDVTISAVSVNEPTITLQTNSYIYDGTAKTPKVIVTGTDGMVIPDTEYTVSYKNNINVGSAAVEITDITGGNYEIAHVSETFAITSRLLTVAADNMTITVGSARPTNFTYKITDGSLADGHKMTVSMSTNITDTSKIIDNGLVFVNDIVIEDGNGSNVTANYNIIKKNGTLSITDHSHSWTYSASENTITAVCSDGCPVKTARVTITAPTGDLVYAPNVKHEAVVEVLPAGIFTPTIVYTKNGEIAEPISAGVYTASIKLDDAAASVRFEIEKADPTVTAEGELNAVYGQTLADIENQLPGGWSWNMRETTSVGEVGRNRFSAVYTPTDTDNYNVKQQDVTVAVTARPVTVTAENKTVVKGAEMPTFTFTSRGLVDGHTVEAELTSVLKSTASVDSADIEVGKIVIRDNGTDVTANYDISKVNGIFIVINHVHSWTYTAKDNTINAVCGKQSECPIDSASITVNAPSDLVYDGEKKTASITGSIDGVESPIISYSGGSTNAGVHAASITLGSATASIEYTIVPAELTVVTVPSASDIEYGQTLANSMLSGGAVRFGGVTVAGTWSWQNSSVRPSAGTVSYTAVFTPSEDADNFNVLTANISVTVNEAEQDEPTYSDPISEPSAEPDNDTLPVDVSNDTDDDLTIESPVGDIQISHESLDELTENSDDVSVTAEKSDDGVTLTVTNISITPGTVAVVINADGTREIIRKSVADNGVMTIPLDGSAKIEIVNNEKTFNDVDDSDWHSEAVDFVSSRELMNGVPSGNFDPDNSMSRAMLAAVLHNLENNPDNMTFGKLNDISDDAWYAEAVLWASENGIVKGYPDGSFAPDLPITREQLAVMLWRYAGSPRECGDIMSTFPDAKNVSDYAKAAMEWAVSNGIIKGDNSRNINPKSHATRAHAAQMIMNFMLNVR